jgi:hypothetical protein
VATWVRDHPGELFAALLVVAWPVIVFGLADYVWFFRDDWSFIAERELSLEDLFEPHNAHWSTVPLVAFRGLYAVFGLHSYVPYLAVVVAAHLGESHQRSDLRGIRIDACRAQRGQSLAPRLPLGLAHAPAPGGFARASSVARMKRSRSPSSTASTLPCSSCVR